MADGAKTKKCIFRLNLLIVHFQAAGSKTIFEVVQFLLGFLRFSLKVFPDRIRTFRDVTDGKEKADTRLIPVVVFHLYHNLQH